MNTLKKIKDKSNVVLITHADCLDGSACAILFKKYVNSNNIWFIKPGELLNTLRDEQFALKNYFVLIADIGISEKEIQNGLTEELNNIKEVVLLDHHKTSFQFKDSLENIAFFDNDRCGSRLLRDYLIYCDLFRNSKNINRFIITVDNHDRWIDPEEGKKYCEVLNFFGQEEFVYKLIKQNCLLNNLDKKIIKQIQEKTKRRIEHVIRDNIRFNKIQEKTGEYTKYAIAITSSVNYSELLQEVLKRFDDIKFACRLNVENRTLSFRARKDYDVSILASKLGGGGHAGAAGVKLSEKEVLDCLKDFYASSIR